MTNKLKSNTAYAVWKITKPSDKREAIKYLKALRYLLSVEKHLWYPDTSMWILKGNQLKKFLQRNSRHPGLFGDVKGTSLTLSTDNSRFIQYAGDDLKIVHEQLKSWLIAIQPTKYDYLFQKGKSPQLSLLRDDGFDYSHSGSVIGAIDVHRGLVCALKVDIANAFKTVTEHKLSLALTSYSTMIQQQLDQASSTVSVKEVISLLVNLMTYRGSLPTGCSHSPMAFNLVFEKVDRALAQIAHRHHVRITRFVDDILISSTKNFSLKNVYEAVKTIIIGNGFVINTKKVKLVNDPPVEYLGCLIYTNKIELSANRVVSYIHFLREAQSDERPELKWNSVTKRLEWVLKIEGKNNPPVPPELWVEFEAYFKLVTMLPGNRRRSVPLPYVKAATRMQHWRQQQRIYVRRKSK